jgi:hypothetical protein
MLFEAFGGEFMKTQVSLGGINGSKRAHVSRKQMKKMLITLFDIKGTVRFEFIPQGQTVNQDYRVEMLKRLHEAVRRKRPKLWPNDWILHHDKAPDHKALSVKQFLGPKIDYLNGTPTLFP